MCMLHVQRCVAHTSCSIKTLRTPPRRARVQVHTRTMMVPLMLARRSAHCGLPATLCPTASSHWRRSPMPILGPPSCGKSLQRLLIVMHCVLASRVAPGAGNRQSTDLLQMAGACHCGTDSTCPEHACMITASQRQVDNECWKSHSAAEGTHCSCCMRSPQPTADRRMSCVSCFSLRRCNPSFVLEPA